MHAFPLRHFVSKSITGNRIRKYFKGKLSGLRHILASESPIKMMKNDFYFILRSLSVLKIFKVLLFKLFLLLKIYFSYLTLWLSTKSA